VTSFAASQPHSRRFRVGAVAADGLRRLGRNAASLVALAAVVAPVLYGIAFAYTQAYAPVSARFGSAYALGTLTWAFYVAVAVAALILRALGDVAAARIGLQDSGRFGTAVVDAVGWILRRAPAIVLVVILLDAPLIVAGALPHTDPFRRALTTGGADALELLVALVVGPIGAVMAAERMGPLAAIARGTRLLNGSRIRVVVVWLIYLPLLVGPWLGFTLLRMALGPGFGAASASYAYAATTQVNYAIESVVSAAIYIELVRLKDGRARVVEVFD
jgi:hypothetical protein